MCFLLRVIRLKKRFRLPRLTLCFQYRFRMVPTTQEPDKFHFVQLLSKMEKNRQEENLNLTLLLCSTFPTRENFNSVFNPILYFSFSHMIECSRRGWIPAFQNSFSSPLFRQLLPISGEFIFLLLLLVVVLNPCVHACVCTMNTYYCQHVRTKGQPQVLTVILHLVSWCLMLPTPHASRDPPASASHLSVEEPDITDIGTTSSPMWVLGTQT